MRLSEGVWKSLHLFAAVCILRLSDLFAARGLGPCRGVFMGICAGLLIESLLAAWTVRMDYSSLTPRRYVWLALRTPSRSDFHAACLVFLLWFALSPGGMFAQFKIAWLVAASFSAAAIVNTSSSRIRLHRRSVY